MSLYRQYRPQFFDDVVGQEAIVTTLKNGLLEGKIAHAYLFCGCRGTGKTTLARLLAKALNCSHPQGVEPCGSCSSCLEIAQGNNLDVLEIDGASNRGIEDIRKLNETVHYAPASGKFKIYIIDEVHMLTKEAFNALLKTLEEPPAHVKFFFATTEPHKVLPTIISRCQRFDLNRIPTEEMTEKLRKIVHEQRASCEESALKTLVLFSEGSLRDAESLLERLLSYTPHITQETTEKILGLVPTSHFFALDEAMHHEQISYAFTLAHTIFSSGKDLNHFLKTLTAHFRNHLHLKYQLPLLVSPQELLSYHKTNSFYTAEQCLLLLEYLVDWEQKMRQMTLGQTVVEMILLYILRSKYKISLASLTKRLIALEQGLSSQEEKQPLEVKEIVISSSATAVPLEPPQNPKVTAAEEKAPPSQESSSSSHYETLLRFAAVELEGTIKK